MAAAIVNTDSGDGSLARTTSSGGFELPHVRDGIVQQRLSPEKMKKLESIMTAGNENSKGVEIQVGFAKKGGTDFSGFQTIGKDQTSEILGAPKPSGEVQFDNSMDSNMDVSRGSVDSRDAAPTSAGRKRPGEALDHQIDEATGSSRSQRKKKQPRRFSATPATRPHTPAPTVTSGVAATAATAPHTPTASADVQMPKLTTSTSPTRNSAANAGPITSSSTLGTDGVAPMDIDMKSTAQTPNVGDASGGKKRGIAAFFKQGPNAPTDKPTIPSTPIASVAPPTTPTTPTAPAASVATANTATNIQSSEPAAATKDKTPPRVVRRELQQREEEYTARLRAIETREEELDRKMSDLKTKAEAAESLELRLTELQAVHDSRSGKAQEFLIETMRKNCNMEKELEQQELLQMKYRVGRIVPRREGHLVTDYWEDGQEFLEMKHRMDEIKAELEQVGALRKALQKKRTTAAREKRKGDEPASMTTDDEIGDEVTDDGFRRPAPVVYDELTEQDEIYKMRLTLLKKELSDLEAKETELDWKKKQVIRNIKRLEDERSSRFNNNPILNNRYLLLRLLGKGGFSEVYKAFDIETYRYVACKIHQLNPQWHDERKRNYTRHATREYNIQKSLVHPRVVQLFDVFAIDLNSFCTVLEYCDGMDLDMYLKIKKTLSEREARIIIMQVFSGLKYMNEQKQKIIHYDLKPGNILFHQGEAKITDFGLSKIVNESSADGIELTSQGAGTYWYLPPETFDMSRKPMISSKVDVWSAGVILYQMLFGKRPFGHGQSQESIVQEQTITKISEVVFPAAPKVSDQTKAFIKRCLQPSVVERPDILEICQDPYLKFRTK